MTTDRQMRSYHAAVAWDATTAALRKAEMTLINAQVHYVNACREELKARLLMEYELEQDELATDTTTPDDLDPDVFDLDNGL